MLNLLIVEDERTVREGLLTMIDWSALGIHIYGQAENGLEALRLLESGDVDLLLTDIRMPIIDGLQLIAEVQSRKLDIACVLLSGFSDFEYAQKALRLGVVDYLIKPCSPRDIRTTFQSVVQRVQDKMRVAADLTGLQFELRMNRKLATSQLLLQWMQAPKLQNEDRKALMNQAQMSIAAQHVLVIAIHPDGKSLRELKLPPRDMELIKYAIGNIAQETLEHALLQPIEVAIKEQEVLAVCNGTYELTLDKLNKGLERLQNNLNQYLKVSATIGVSDSKESIDLLSEAYREAHEAVQMRFYKGAGNCFFYRNVPSPAAPAAEPGSDTDLVKLEQSIVDQLRAGLYAEALNDTELWLTGFHDPNLYDRSTINMHTYSLVVRLLHLAEELGVAERLSTETFKSLPAQIDVLETYEELAGLVSKAIQQLVEALNSNKTPRRKIQQALDYIARHYNSPGISLAGVAKELFVSSTYLSTLFKQELGINFLDYVHQYRIEKAKAMLQSGDHKIQSIAKEVGYFDEAHFTKTFKKWAGILPSQYKKNIMDMKK
ncbi:response regulator [Paenibacillus athensensis]|uniref:AraC family transcriptional regulator n=1 Tax=Paenibacillus athensensis TaxID=1967502 RepID=A0A4Y8Q181_9BACL|nr:response regulator [Paenibacillus athensensis]MCD1261162.1 response regulator [Paenibacillus athensensis]